MNNSGRSQRGLAENTERKVDQELFEINVMGTILLTKAVLPHMIERKTGHIVVVSSVAGKIGGSFSMLYHTASSAFEITYIFTKV